LDAACDLHLLNVGKRGEILAGDAIDRQASGGGLATHRGNRDRAIRESGAGGIFEPQHGGRVRRRGGLTAYRRLVE
jgi:hypothetical protein